MTKLMMLFVILATIMFSSAMTAASEVEGEEPIVTLESDDEGAARAVLLKLRARKNQTFSYDVHAEITRKTVLKDSVIREEENQLDMNYTQKCTIVEPDGVMGFDVTYGDYKLERKITENKKISREVYTPEGLTIYKDGKLALSRKWSEMPRSEQAEVRKVFVRGYSFAANPSGEIKELWESMVFEHELPMFHALRLQQAVYYTSFTIAEGTLWNWKEPVVLPKQRDHPLSGKTVPTRREYELVLSRELDGMLCAALNVKEESRLKDLEGKVNLDRKMIQKAYIEEETGMAILVEGTIESELSSGSLDGVITTTVTGKFIINRHKEDPDEPE